MSAYAGIVASAAGASYFVVIDFSSQPYFQTLPVPQLGLICTVSSGASLTYSVQVTADPTPSASGHWNNHDTLAGLTASANGNVAYPITGLRLNVTTWASGSVNLGIAKWP